jgi:hypothetical protein
VGAHWGSKIPPVKNELFQAELTEIQTGQARSAISAKVPTVQRVQTDFGGVALGVMEYQPTDDTLGLATGQKSTATPHDRVHADQMCQSERAPPLRGRVGLRRAGQAFKPIDSGVIQAQFSREFRR